MIIANKNDNGTLLSICLARDSVVANGPSGRRVKQPPYTSELKIAGLPTNFK